MKQDNQHVSVFLNKAIELLQIKQNGNYLDCTFGRGGHSQLILNELKKTGKLWVIDCDLEAVKYFNDFFHDSNIIMIHDFFDNLEKIANENQIENLDGILYDLGVSSPQLDDHNRGFSYHGSDLLDMRMNHDQEFSAIDLINNYSKEQLNEIFYKYGEIKKPIYVTNEIIRKRQEKQITLTSELVDIIKAKVHPKELYQSKHPARKYFQAIRIAVNNELQRIEKSLYQASKLLKKNGRIVVISFHSLEEKIVKNVFYDLTKIDIPKEVPILNVNQKFKIIKIKQKLSEIEKLENNRARSAKIWCLEKL